jgi:hypothetical protein
MQRVPALVVIGVIAALGAATGIHLKGAVPSALPLEYLQHLLTSIVPSDAILAILLPTQL